MLRIGQEDISPLHLAAASGCCRSIECLLGLGALIDKQSRPLGNTALIVAVIGGHDEAVDLLCGHGADCTVSDSNGDTPIHAAGKHGRLSAIRTLKVSLYLSIYLSIYLSTYLSNLI